MMQLLVAALFVVLAARYAGKSGARRYNALPDDRARQQHEVFASRSFGWFILVGIAAATADAALAGFFGPRNGVTVAASALALWLLALVLDRSARANVNAGFAQRQIEPMPRLEASARRERRQKQFALVAIGGYLAGRVLSVAADETSQTWLAVPAAVGLVLAVSGALALVWAMA